MMNELSKFSGSPELKFAFITKSSFDADPVAQQLSTSPSVITKEGIELVILSIPTDQVAELVDYAEQAANGVEFDLTLGTGKVTLLTHTQTLELIASTAIEDNI